MAFSLARHSPCRRGRRRARERQGPPWLENVVSTVRHSWPFRWPAIRRADEDVGAPGNAKVLLGWRMWCQRFAIHGPFVGPPFAVPTGTSARPGAPRSSLAGECGVNGSPFMALSLARHSPCRRGRRRARRRRARERVCDSHANAWRKEFPQDFLFHIPLAASLKLALPGFALHLTQMCAGAIAKGIGAMRPSHSAGIPGKFPAP
jgi:hypothetical protein